MRVICIENSLLVDRDNPNCGSICAHKGSIYNVIGSVDAQKLRDKTGINFASGVWYEFLEVRGLHHHIRFLELPEDDLLETQKTENYEHIYN